MTLCPIAIAAGCRKCPAFSFCPLKGVIGDFREEAKDADQSHAAATPGKDDPAQGSTGTR